MNFNMRLIELVKSYEILYDYNNECPGIQARRDFAWKEIARRLEAEESECKKAWYLLREGYRRILKRRKAAEGDVVFRKDKVIPKWTYEDELSFLEPHLKNRTWALAKTKDQDSHNNIDNQVNPEASGHNSKRRATQDSATRRTCANETYSNTLIKYILEKSTKRDDIQNFFDSIASTVHKFPPHDRVIAKTRVFEVISQMELEILGRQTQSTSTFQYENSPASCEVITPQNELYNPHSVSPVLIDSNSSDEEMEPETAVKVESEPTMIIKFEPET